MARSTGDIGVYSSLDPDEIYKPGSQTFFYVPASGNLYVEPFPTNHRDMLENNDELFFELYPDLKKRFKTPGLDPELVRAQRANLSSRGQALARTNALLGRIGAAGDAICIVFWTDPTPEVFGNFLSKLFAKFTQFRAIQDKVVVVSPRQGAKALTDMIGGPPAERAVALKKPRKKKAAAPAAAALPAPTRTYSDEEIELYRRMHLATGDEKKQIMARLGVGGMGSNVEHPWKKALRVAGLPGGGPGQKWWAPTSEGFTFRDWIAYQDAIS
jgi:hypothetical protein